MTQEDKDLLLKDLCGRLPYGVKGLVTFNGHPSIPKIQEDRTIDGKLYDRFAKFQDSWYDNVTIKPYLFPMSSMTEEQDKYFGLLQAESIKCEFLYPFHCANLMRFIYENHLDYMDLIGKGLANDATGLNIY